MLNPNKVMKSENSEISDNFEVSYLQADKLISNNLGVFCFIIIIFFGGEEKSWRDKEQNAVVKIS